jgi:hypothetical protein
MGMHNMDGFCVKNSQALPVRTACCRLQQGRSAARLQCVRRSYGKAPKARSQRGEQTAGEREFALSGDKPVLFTMPKKIKKSLEKHLRFVKYCFIMILSLELGGNRSWVN